jgi:hypothetical protein
MRSQNEMLLLIRNFLQSNGWVLFDRSAAALAFKMYDSAVGKKEAQVYLDGDQYYWRLSGLYESQGQNILSTNSVLIPVEIDVSQLSDFFSQFLENVESAIANSFAVRLLHHFGE